MLRRFVSPFATALTLAACGSDPSGPGRTPARLTALPRPLTSGEARVRDASNTFAFGLLREVNRAHRDSNVFVSPLSASMALGMTLNGARGATLDSMRVALGVSALTLGEINAGYKGLDALLRGLDPSTDVRVANSVWARTGFAVNPAFSAAVRDNFAATARDLDFAAPGAATTINGWVSDNTAGKIKTIVDAPIPANVVMYLINAVYFKGAWREAFERPRTQDAPFTAAGGRRLAVPTMHQTADSAGYLRAPGVTLLELSYGNAAYAMTIVLPDSGRTAEALVDSLSPERWAAWTAGLRERSVEIALPRFRLEWEDRLNTPLAALGMGIAFTSAADFTGINDAGGLLISEVKQKTFVDVNEEGTEAAAATSVGIALTSAPVIPTVRVDRPFVVAIRERLTGSILFLGKVAAP
jgi:serpin B